MSEDLYSGVWRYYLFGFIPLRGYVSGGVRTERRKGPHIWRYLGVWRDACPALPLVTEGRVCPKCKGKGTLPGKNYVAPNKSGPPNCFVCNGEGRL